MNSELKTHNIPHGQGKAIAELAGVSQATVANVLNNKRSVAVDTRLRVMQAAKEVLARLAKKAAKADKLLASLSL